MPITSLTWTSRQARTHRLHWMQASRLTRMAGWLASGAPALGRQGSGWLLTCTKSAWLQKCEVGSCEVARSGWSATSSSSTIARALVARSVAVLTFMPTAGAALAGRRQHALALDLDHAGAAVAVRAVAGRGLVAQVRDVGAETLRDRPDGLSGLRLDLLAVELEHDARPHARLDPALVGPGRRVLRRCWLRSPLCCDSDARSLALPVSSQRLRLPTGRETGQERNG